MTKKRYISQFNSYFCGPACLQMLAADRGERLTQSRLAKRLRTTRSRGTKRRWMVRTAASLGLRPHAHHASSMAELRAWLAAGARVIVDYLEPEGEIHFAVVDRVAAGRVVMRDPWHGPAFSMALSEFLPRWRGTHPRANRRWILVARSFAVRPVRCPKKTTRISLARVVPRHKVGTPPFFRKRSRLRGRTSPEPVEGRDPGTRKIKSA